MALPEDRSKDGRFKSEYPDGDFLAAVDELTPHGSTQKIADLVGCNRDTAYRRLDRLEDEGYLDSEKLGNVRIWLLE
jgi:DNA-binding IclR family transcriptional regulator